MNSLKLIFIALLSFFILPVQNIFAQDEQIFTNLKCSNIKHSYCNHYSVDLPLGYDDWKLSESQKRTMWDTTCRFLTKNDNATLKSYKLGSSDNIVQFKDSVNVLERWRWPVYTEIICEIPKTQITVTNKNIPDETYTESTLPDKSNPLNYCDATWPYEISKISLDHKVEHGYVFYSCTYMGDSDIIFNDESMSLLRIEKIEWCTDTSAVNYNPHSNVHIESLCEYAPTYTPKNITGVFEKSQVSSGATTWNIRLTLNVPDVNVNTSSIQIWDHFEVVSATTLEKTLTLTLRQFDYDRLAVECTNYEVTIPKHALTTTQWDKNESPIIGNFEVTGCEKPTSPANNDNENNNQPKHENTIKDNNFYLSLYDTDEKGKIYINLTNVIYILGFISFFLILFFVLFWFIKNSFLWKSKRY